MRAPAIDFLRPPRPPLLGWVLLAAGLLGLVGALWLEQRWSTERSAAEREAQAALDARRVDERPKPPPAPTAAQLRWQQAQVELRRPWLPALRAMESATVNPVYLLSMSIEPATGLIKLEAEAPSFDHAMAYVQTLDEGGVLQPATLISHEQTSEQGSGRPFVRFAATTRWNLR